MIRANPSVEGEIALFKLTGRWTMSSVFDLVEAVTRFCREHDLERVLVDSRDVSTPLSDLHRHSAGKYIAEHVGNRLKVAVVYREDFFNKMLELSAVNRGAMVLVTPSEEEARSWLLEDILGDRAAMSHATST